MLLPPAFQSCTLALARYTERMKDAALVDCRPVDEYQAGHMRDACSLPADTLFERMHELPLRSRPLRLCGKLDDLTRAADYLIDRGHAVTERIVWTDSLKQQLSASGELVTGPESAQLWQPAGLWRQFVEDMMPAHAIVPGVGLDIACGAGRDMVYLAQQGWQMTGVDRSADSLRRVEQLAQSVGVAVSTLQRDLETGDDPFPELADGHFDLIAVGRYLHRPLFPVIKRLMKPGGVLLYQTFLTGCEKTAIGRPRNPAFLLQPGELAAAFSGADILCDAIETLPDGRPINSFVARLV